MMRKGRINSFNILLSLIIVLVGVGCDDIPRNSEIDVYYGTQFDGIYTKEHGDVYINNDKVSFKEITVESARERDTIDDVIYYNTDIRIEKLKKQKKEIFFKVRSTDHDFVGNVELSDGNYEVTGEYIKGENAYIHDKIIIRFNKI